MARTILVTGANGFTGFHLLESLRKQGHKVIPFVQPASDIPDEIVVDFNSKEFSELLYGIPKVDYVVHLGARIGWEGGTKEELFVPNVLATTQLALFAKSHDAHFLFSSAAIVCGVSNPNITSESITNPDTDYGFSKWLAEENIRMSGVRHSILRISGIFGQKGPKHLGLNRAIDCAMAGKVPEIHGKGNILRNYIYVEDLVNIIEHCMDKNITGTHLVAGPRGISMNQMLQTICDRFLPGSCPERHQGNDGNNQVVEHSASLPEGRPFDQAIQHIYETHMEGMT